MEVDFRSRIATIACGHPWSESSNGRARRALGAGLARGADAPEPEADAREVAVEGEDRGAAGRLDHGEADRVRVADRAVRQPLEPHPRGPVMLGGGELDEG